MNNETIILISGVPYVGKTSVAYALLKKEPQIKAITEMDIIKTAASYITSYISKQTNLDDWLVDINNKTTNCSIKELIYHCTNMLEIIRAIAIRQKARKIPTIIEGSCIIPKIFFINDKPRTGFEENVYFINLYISNETIHFNNRLKRNVEREYEINTNEISKEIEILRSKNRYLNTTTKKLEKQHHNVKSIDVSYKSIDCIVNEIIEFVYQS